MPEVREVTSNRLWQLAESLERTSLPVFRAAVNAAEVWQNKPNPFPSGLVLDPSFGRMLDGQIPTEAPTVVYAGPDPVTLCSVWSQDGYAIWPDRSTGPGPVAVNPRPRYDGRKSFRRDDDPDPDTAAALWAVQSVADYGLVVSSLLGLREHLTTKARRAPLGEARRVWTPALSRTSDVLADHLSRVPDYLGQVLVPTEKWASVLPTRQAPTPVGSW